MVSWPYTRLHCKGDRLVAISGPYIQVIHSITGDIQHVTRYPANILCSAVDATGSYIITTGDDKKLQVWNAAGLELKSTRELPKKATTVKFTGDGQTIIVADKFGDVFAYPLDPPTTANVASHPRTSEAAKRESVASHENPHGTLVLGHASIITTFLLSHDGRFILTADRDEHIRVSRYPQGYIIERYCLGHTRYVSAICLPSFEPGTLVSGGGDPYLTIWDWMSGKLKCQIPTLDFVRPFLKVRENKQSWHQAAGKPHRTGRKGRRRGKKANDNQKEDEAVVEMDVVDEPTKPTSVDAKNEEDPVLEQAEPVLVVANLEAFEFDGEKVLVFSFVGGTALIYCKFPTNPSDVPALRHLDLSCPILDFVLGPEGHILISVDVNYLSTTEDSQIRPPVRAVTWHEGEVKLVEKTNGLITTLNGSALQSASISEVNALGLYADLALLPKHAEGPEYDGDEPDPEIGGEDVVDSSQSDVKKPTAKTMGRLKTKQAILKKQEMEQRSSRSVSRDVDERESKKVKLDEEDMSGDMI